MNTLEELLEYAEWAARSECPFEVQGEQLAIVLEAMRLLKASRSEEAEEHYDCPIHGMQDGDDCPRC